MHPRVFLDSLWRNDLRNEVFVAMSFDPRFDDRWIRIFKPAIEQQPIEGIKLTAVRVDIRRSGNSILSEIIDGVAHSHLVFADVSVTDTWQHGDSERWARNGNVMYEVGLAMACRQPVEIVLVRDDRLPLLFDISHIPVLQFDPLSVDESITVIQAVLQDRLRERELIKDLRFASTMESLAQLEINIIRQNAHLSFLGWKGPSYPAAVGIALPRILDKRILRLVRPGNGDNPDVYTWTAFGRAVADYIKGMEATLNLPQSEELL